jgi:CYTH domain-containing protein
MSTTRVFLLASGLARLIERERAGELVRHGYFPEHPDRSTHVQATGDSCHLILVSHSAKGPSEDAAAISPAQAEALLGLTAGRIEYLSIAIDIGSYGTTIQRLLTPGPLDLVSVAFKHDKAARAFQPPAWFGREVSGDSSYRPRAIAINGLPMAPEVEVSNAALISLLDSLDHQDEEAKPRAAWRTPPASSEPAFAADDDHEVDGLTIEDSVLRDLARSLQPQER